MGRKVNTAWFGLYREVESSLPARIAAGEHRADVIGQYAQTARVTHASLVRMLKAGRYLDSQLPNLAVEGVLCSYMQVDLLEKISRLNPQLAAARLRDVVCNRLSLDELKALYTAMKEQDPAASATISRDNTRRLTTSHERHCIEAIRKVDGAFFGYPDGTILRQSDVHPYASPHFLVITNGKPAAAIFARVGGKSKSPRAMAYDLMYLALAVRHWVPNVWFVFPEASHVSNELAALAVYLKASPKDQHWLHIAFVEEPTLTLRAMKKGDYLIQGARDIFHRSPDCFWTGKELKSGKEHMIKLIQPPQIT